MNLVMLFVFFKESNNVFRPGWWSRSEIDCLCFKRKASLDSDNISLIIIQQIVTYTYLLDMSLKFPSKIKIAKEIPIFKNYDKLTVGQIHFRNNIFKMIVIFFYLSIT